MKNRFEADKAAEYSAAQRARNLATYKNWLGKHPEIKDCIANQKEFEEYLDWSDEFTEADLDFAFGNMSSRSQLAKQRIPSEAEIREELIDNILDLLTSKNDGRDGLFSKANLRSEKIRMASWTTAKLQARLSEILSKQAQAKLSVPELKEIVRASQPQRRLDGYPNLPDFIVMPGNVQATKCDAAFLLRLAKQDLFEYRRLVSRFGTDQINERQQGKS